ncbi:type I restriction-modification system, S subunit [Mycoplasma haemocanis str. Illinois]|uniref:Type I restriction-modification system, S subunit n=1 Tax=Mycoplasma haemocanis (strain Illinois) TaxID=1111676 RepID=H6N6Y2_MYCHN|nr:type I restriction-modification system, S subunit [Mycoplasma haemocanis str. Illinois]
MVRKGLSFKESHYLESGTPVLKKGNIKVGKVNNESLFYCDERNHKVLDTHRVRYGDVVITNLDPQAGRVGINLTDTEFILCGEVFKLEPNPRILDRKYLYYFLVNFPHKIEQLLTSSNVVRLRASSIEKFKIRVPDLETQRNIVKQLDTFQELREELRMRKSQGVYYRDKIMRYLQDCSSAKK